MFCCCKQPDKHRWARRPTFVGRTIGIARYCVTLVWRHPPCPLCSRPAACPPPWGGRRACPGWRRWTVAGRRSLRQCWWRASGPSRLWRSPPAPPWKRRQREVGGEAEGSEVRRLIPRMRMHKLSQQSTEGTTMLSASIPVHTICGTRTGRRKKKSIAERSAASPTHSFKAGFFLRGQPQLFPSSFCAALKKSTALIIYSEFYSS